MKNLILTFSAFIVISSSCQVRKAQTTTASQRLVPHTVYTYNPDGSVVKTIVYKPVPSTTKATKRLSDNKSMDSRMSRHIDSVDQRNPFRDVYHYAPEPGKIDP